MSISTINENAKNQSSEDITLNALENYEGQENETTDEATQSKDEKTFTFKICRKWTIHIYKPLIALKLALFCWYGAGSLVGPFLTVFLKQRGMTLEEVSVLYILTPIVQTLGPVVSGVIADKLGRSKPVLLVNVLLTVATIGSILIMPRLNSEHCEPQLVKLKCHHREFDRLVARSKCDITMDSVKLEFCNVNCPENVTESCMESNLICELLSGEHHKNFSLSANVNFFYKRKSKCYHNVTSVTYKNASYSWCNIPHKMNCKINCTLNPSEDCSEESQNRFKLLVVYFIVLVFFYTFFSNGYRFLDVTSMALVKEHNSSYGRERFFSISGVLIFSPLAGYIVDATSVEGEKHYDAAFYLFIFMIIFTLGVIYKLKVQINPPGKRMWKKTCKMAKNPDIVSFVLVVFVLGSAWGFTKIYMYWYLEELKAPSYLLGLLPAAAGLYGLPFLLTSSWWVKKIGPTNILVLGLLGYVLSAVGYSFLLDPWIALCLEATCILTYHLLWVSVIMHSHEIAPEGMRATVVATAGGIHFSVGKGSGSLIGGLVMSKFGGRIAFRVIAIICLISAVLYALYLYIRHRFFNCKKNAKETDDDKNMEFILEEDQEHFYSVSSKFESLK